MEVKRPIDESGFSSGFECGDSGQHAQGSPRKWLSDVFGSADWAALYVEGKEIANVCRNDCRLISSRLADGLAEGAVTTWKASAFSELADEIERSNGLILMVPGQGTMQLGINKSAQVIAALRHTAQSRIPAGSANVLKTMDELHDVAFKNGWDAALASKSQSEIADEAEPKEEIDRLSRRKLSCRELARYILDRVHNKKFMYFEQDIARLFQNERRAAVERARSPSQPELADENKRLRKALEIATDEIAKLAIPQSEIK